MALKDLKSDLSKFRMPKKDPLVNKKREPLKKKQNQTPLSSMLKSRPNLEASDKTPTKQGTKVNKFDNSSNFLGETNPSTFDNSSNFLGETNQTSMDNSSRFLGETCPNTFDNSSKFLGETTPKPVDFFTNDKATGFTFNFNNVDTTKFVGVNPSNTIFDSTNSLYSNFLNSSRGISFSAGYDGYKPIGSYTGDTQRYNPDIKYSTDSFKELAIPSNGILTGQDGTGFLNHYWGTRAIHSWNNGFTTFRPGYGSFKFNSALHAPQYSGLNPGNDFHYTTDTHIPKLKQVDRGLLQLQDGTGFINDHWVTRAANAFYAGIGFRPGYADLKFSIGDSIPAPQYSGLNPGDDFHYTTEQSRLSLKPKLKQVGRGIQNLQEPTFIKDLYDRDVNLAKSAFPEFNFKFRPGYQNFKSSDFIAESSPRFNYGSGYTTDTNAGIPELTDSSNNIKNLSPFNNYYNKFNLKDDSYNVGSLYSALAGELNKALDYLDLGQIPTQIISGHPLMLSGIQKKDGEPERYGQFGHTPKALKTFDDGYIRGGVLTSTARAAVDFLRIGSWLTSTKGLMWSGRQVLQQNTNKYGKAWTPVGLLAAVGGQHLGLHAQRPGLIPLLDETFYYGNKAKRLGDDIDFMYKKLSMIASGDKKTGGGLSKVVKFISKIPIIGNAITGLDSWKLPQFGGFNSVYGVGFTAIRRNNDYNTFSNTGKSHAATVAAPKPKLPTAAGKGASLADAGMSIAGQTGTAVMPVTPGGNSSELAYTQKFNPFSNPIVDTPVAKYSPTPDDTDYIINEKSVPKDPVGKMTFGLAGRKGDISGLPSISGKEKSDQLTPSILIDDYETISYGKLPERRSGETTPKDFRVLKMDEQTKKDFEDNNGYDKFNLDTSGDRGIQMGNPGKIRTGTTKGKWWGVDTKDNDGMHNRVNALEVHDDDDIANSSNDIVHLWFKGASKYAQFSGTVSGINESFNPSWEGVKYNGRADSAFKYSSFSRTLNFNFNVIATSRVEMVPIWNKLQHLASLTMPEYPEDSNGYRGNLINFRLGNLYYNQLAFITSLTYTMRDDMSWEISPRGSDNDTFLGELPRGIDVSIGLQILDANRAPSVGSKFYTFNSDKWDNISDTNTQNQNESFNGTPITT
jgi:hypothetical protein